MFANISIWQLLIVLVIVIAIFGTKRLKTLGSDLGSAVKGFRNAVNEAENQAENEPSGELDDKSEDANFDNTPVEESESEKKRA
jgi:sec-independent protein translocase protein TatA